MNRPAVNIVVQFFAAVSMFIMLALCVWAIRDGWFPTEAILIRHPDPDDMFYLYNRQLALWSGVLAIVSITPIALISRGGGRPGVWNLILGLLILSALVNPLVGIILIIFWCQQNNRAYYGKGQGLRADQSRAGGTKPNFS